LGLKILNPQKEEPILGKNRNPGEQKPNANNQIWPNEPGKKKPGQAIWGKGPLKWTPKPLKKRAIYTSGAKGKNFPPL